MAKEESNNILIDDTLLTKFADDLTRLSQTYGIGLAGELIPYVMEYGDEERTYQINKDGNLEFI